MIPLCQIDNLFVLVVRVMENTEIIKFMVIDLNIAVLLWGPCRGSGG